MCKCVLDFYLAKQIILRRITYTDGSHTWSADVACKPRTIWRWFVSRMSDLIDVVLWNVWIFTSIHILCLNVLWGHKRVHDTVLLLYSKPTSKMWIMGGNPGDGRISVQHFSGRCHSLRNFVSEAFVPTTIFVLLASQPVVGPCFFCLIAQYNITFNWVNAEQLFKPLPFSLYLYCVADANRLT